MKRYCTECNQPTESASAPRFCSTCGAEFDLITGKAHPRLKAKVEPVPKRIQPPVRPQLEATEIEPDNEVDNDDDDTASAPAGAPDIGGIEIEVERPRGERFEDIVASAPREDRPSKAPFKYNRKKFMEEYQKEAGFKPKTK